MANRITKTKIREDMGIDAVSIKGGVVTVRRAFFYTHGKTAANLVASVLAVYPTAQIIDSGESWKPFNGGAPVSKQSHWWVKFTVPADAPVPDAIP